MPRPTSGFCGLRGALFVIGLSTALSLTLCASGTDAGERSPRGFKQVQSLLELRHQRVVLQNYDISCGAAALATILNYQHADPVTEDAIATSMLAHTEVETVRARLGFSLLDLKRYVERRGYVGDGYGNLGLQDLVSLGPAIVPVRILTYDHFVVFRGLHRDRILLADPAFGNRTMTVREFLRVWPKRIAFVVDRQDDRRPPDQLSGEEAEFVYPSRAVIRAALR
jgi:uncharacterized protein